MSDMSRTEIIDVLLNEMECVQRASDDECNRDCAECDLLRDTDKILQAYKIAIKALEHPEENVVKIIPHGNLISRQAVLKIVEREQFKGDAISEIEKLPSVNPQPKTGHWIKKEDDTCWWYACSECEQEPLKNKWNDDDVLSTFCPNCGARMVEPQESEDKG